MTNYSVKVIWNRHGKLWKEPNLRKIQSVSKLCKQRTFGLLMQRKRILQLLPFLWAEKTYVLLYKFIFKVSLSVQTRPRNIERISKFKIENSFKCKHDFSVGVESNWNWFEIRFENLRFDWFKRAKMGTIKNHRPTTDLDHRLK